MYEQLKLDNQLCFRLYTASRLVTQAYRPFLEPLNLTYPQYLVLMVLWENDCQPVNDIAKRLMLETNTVTPLVQRMERQGIVLRKRGKIDTRQRLVCLTDKGKALEQQAKDVPVCLSGKLCELGADTDEMMQMMTSLDKFIELLSSKSFAQ